MPKKEDSTRNVDVTSQTGLSAATITSVKAWIHGVVFVVEMATSAGTTYIKFRQGSIEYGGDANWNTGTRAV